MDNATKQALLSAVRAILVAIGGMLAARGFISDETVNQFIGPIMVIIPILWGVWDKYQVEKRTQVRETIAVNAGIASTEPAVPAVTPAEAQTIIKGASK